MTAKVQGCVLCEGPGGRLVFEGAKLRVIHAEEAGFPAFYRVVWREHAPESPTSTRPTVSCAWRR